MRQKMSGDQRDGKRERKHVLKKEIIVQERLSMRNSVGDDEVMNNGTNLDWTLHDLAKCFDSHWYEETINNLWDVGV